MKKIPVKVSVQTLYLPEQSNPTLQRFLWSYEITIENESDVLIQLLNRYWKITDLNGRIEEVRGPGVIGLQPLIKPKSKFVYTSFCQLVTAQGTMEGHYEMQTLDETLFVVDIPKFVLTAPPEVMLSFRSLLH